MLTLLEFSWYGIGHLFLNPFESPPSTTSAMAKRAPLTTGGITPISRNTASATQIPRNVKPAVFPFMTSFLQIGIDGVIDIH
jgi:hypothetical protein